MREGKESGPFLAVPGIGAGPNKRLQGDALQRALVLRSRFQQQLSVSRSSCEAASRCFKQLLHLIPLCDPWRYPLQQLHVL